jgi:hypothetical protein
MKSLNCMAIFNAIDFASFNSPLVELIGCEKCSHPYLGIYSLFCTLFQAFEVHARLLICVRQSQPPQKAPSAAHPKISLHPGQGDHRCTDLIILSIASFFTLHIIIHAPTNPLFPVCEAFQQSLAAVALGVIQFPANAA